jgi:molybdopterin-binding protein
MDLFRIENLGITLGGREVLDIRELFLPDGEIIALTGSNGSGKTTLLLILAGLLFPDRGRLLCRGLEITSFGADKLDAHRRNLGAVLQSPYLFKTNVEQNVAYGLARRGVPRKTRQEKVSEALQLVGLEGFEKRHCSALSGGEAQRVALARALVLQPEVLLLDEPFANVDAASRLIIERIFAQENRYSGTSVLFTTHDLDQACRLADTVVTLHEGKIHEGIMENLFHGKVRMDFEGPVFDTGRMSLAIPPGKEDARTATVPPETILLSLTPASTSARNNHLGLITGARQHNGTVEVTLNAGELFLARLTESSYREMDLKLGMEVYLIFKAEAVRLY